MNKDLTMRVTYGADQVLIIDKLLTEMEGDGHIVTIERGKEFVDKSSGYKMVPYVIEFRTVYSAYKFGHLQGSYANRGDRAFQIGYDL